jgi:catechol 2,3-dioxygenase-like lactoylglutathione lyase family enzyme
MLKPTTFDHIVLNVRDVEKSLEFYSEVLGFEIDVPRLERFRKGETGFATVRINQDTIVDLFPKTDLARSEQDEIKNLNHFAVAFEKFEMSEFIKLLKQRRIQIVRGPMTLAGAKGKGEILNILDPDSNSIEIRQY